MAGKKTGKRLLTWVLVLVMALSLLPLNALAANRPETDSSSGMNFTKKLLPNQPDDDGNYTIRMTAQATGKTTETSTAAPMDIVLVLDQSGSMAFDFDGNKTSKDEDRRQYAMKAAVNSFIDEVAKKYTPNANHHMAIVTFDTNATELVGWTAVYGSDKDKLTDAIDNLTMTPSGATNVGKGMTKTEALMDDAPTGQNRQKTVIVFTDGVPTTESDFDTDVANKAISAAKRMKDADVTIYTVGIFNGAYPAELYGKDKIGTWGSDEGKCSGEKGDYWQYRHGLFSGGDIEEADIAAGNRFLNYLSSNYDASEIGVSRYTINHVVAHYIGFNITDDTARGSNEGYYKTAVDASALNGIFKTISDTIVEPENDALNENTVITDTLSDYFTFALTEDGKVDVKVYAEKRNGDMYLITDGITVDGKTVTVTGYDFSKHHTESDDPETLVIKIKVKPSGEGCATAKIPTNEGNATVTLDNKEIDKATPPTVDGYSVEYVIGDGASWPNNGNGPETLYYPQDADVAVTDSVPMQDGYEFTGWNTKEDGTGTTYKANGTLTITGNTTLYAQWKAKEYSFTVNYLWDNVPIPNIPSTTGSDALGTEVVPSTDIDGYTLISGQQTSMTIGTGENVLKRTSR